jgi:hypothetical protein
VGDGRNAAKSLTRSDIASFDLFTATITEGCESSTKNGVCNTMSRMGCMYSLFLDYLWPSLFFLAFVARLLTLLDLITYTCNSKEDFVLGWV